MKRTVGLFVLSPTSQLVRKATGHYRLTCRLPSARNVPLEKELLIPLQEKKVSYTCGQLFLIMCHHNHGLVLTTTESFYHIFHQPALYKSNPCKGSSKISNSGSFTKARANNTRRCSPLDNCKKFRSFKSAIPKISIHHSQAAICSGRGRCTTPQNHVVRLPQYLWQEGSSDKRDASQD